MADEAATAATVNKAVVRSVSHPVAFAIMRIFCEREIASGREIAALVSKPRSSVGDQLRILEAEGLIECVAEEAKRGTVERFYRATPAARWVDDEEMAHVSPEERRRMAVEIIRSAVTDASAALAANTLAHRANHCLSSMRVAVDEQGWRELSDVHRHTIEEVERVRDESAERLAGGMSGESLRALSSVMLLELPAAT
ncbi:MAG TPA: hypothetical protein VNL97_07000 [Solirubrobacterales bacterium]|nr:hypothetical protein [Solirubrobacterales bacterium]